jgi:hypothetical protein
MRMSPESTLLALLLALILLGVVWEAWARRRRVAPRCPHCGSRLASIAPGRRHCERCNVYFRRI